jgi:hypothetical protein
MLNSIARLGAVGMLIILAAACGDDDDGASNEAYFKGLDAVIARADERFEGEAFENITSAREGLENVAAVFEDAEAEFDELQPPEDVEDLHRELVARTESQAASIREVAAETADNLPPDELGRLFEEEPLSSLTGDAPDSPNCQLKEIADERGIDVGNLGCDLDGEEDDDDEEP